MAYGKSSKEKVMGKLSEYEKADQRVHIGITIEKRNVDGEVIKVARLDRDDYAPIPVGSEGPMERKLPREYTDMEEFGKCVASVLKGISSQL